MQEYGVSMPIRFLPDEHSLSEIKNTMDTLGDIKLFDDDEQMKNFKSAMNSFAADKATLEKLTSVLSDYKEVMNLGDKDDEYTKKLTSMINDVIGKNKVLKEQFGDGAKEFSDVLIGNLQTKFIVSLGNLSKKFLESIGQVFTNAWNELNNMLQSSLLTNPVTRNNAFSYGMTASESYGFEQAKSMFNISSEEDLWYMNDQQTQKFQEVMMKYATKYDELADQGFFEQMLDFQVERQEFELDMQMEIIGFFMDNKDTIKQFMKLGISTMEFIVDALGWLMDFFGSGKSSESSRSSNIESILNSYTQSTTSNSIKVENTNNFNGTTDSQKQAYLDMLSAQVVEAKRVFGG